MTLEERNAVLEEAAMLANKLETGVAIEIGDCTMPLGVMAPNPGMAQRQTAAAIAEAIRRLKLKPLN